MRKIAILSAIALVLVSCFNPWQGDGGTVSISIGSGGNGRSVVPVPGYDGKTSADLYHRITITDSFGTAHEGKLTPNDGDKKDFFSLALGPCTIRVEGFLDEGFTERVSIIKEDSEDIKDGIKTITIKAGVNPVYITMKFIDEEGGYDLPLIPGLYEGTPEDPNSTLTLIDYENVPANDIVKAFKYVEDYAGTYTLLIDGDVEADETVRHTLKQENRHVTIIGLGAPRTIKAPAKGAVNEGLLFTIKNASSSLTLGKNITLTGSSTTFLVRVEAGSLTMLEGSKITGYTTTNNSGAVVVNTSGEFFMKGGEISGNSTSVALGVAAGGVNVAVGGTFVMSGGAITGNVAAGGIQGDVLVIGKANFTLSGNARIGVITLAAQKPEGQAQPESSPINLSGYTNLSQTVIHLSNNTGVDSPGTNETQATINHWSSADVKIITGDMSVAIGRFTLGGQFFAVGLGTAAATASAAGYYIGNSDTEIGRLVKAQTLTSIDGIGAYLASQSGGNTDNEPIYLLVDIGLGTMTDANGVWRQILAAINTAGKYVALDLSACTMTGTAFDPDYTVSTGKDRIVSIALPNTAESIPDDDSYNRPSHAFLYFTALKSFSGTGLTSIGIHAFYCLLNLNMTELPSKLTSIGDAAFYGCSTLALTTLPSGLISLGDAAFYDCYGLTRISLPANLASIGSSAFYTCKELSTVTCLSTTPPTLGITVFSYKPAGEDDFIPLPKLQIKVPAGNLNAYKTAANWSMYAGMISGQ